MRARAGRNAPGAMGLGRGRKEPGGLEELSLLEGGRGGAHATHSLEQHIGDSVQRSMCPPKPCTSDGLAMGKRPGVLVWLWLRPSNERELGGPGPPGVRTCPHGCELQR